MLQVYNTLGRELQQFKPLKQDIVKLYSCGPTVYNRAHIGNLKTSVVVDFVSRSLRFMGYNLVVTMNLTDVDDKTIRDSMQAGESLKDFTQKYSKLFLEDLQALNCVMPDNIVPVTSLMPEMIRMIQTMLNRGIAYLADDGSVYFDISKSKKYGKLANLDTKGMKTSVRVDNDEYEKENASDFVLWKAWKESDGENFWNADFTISNEKVTLKGRPGWHIECSACNMKYFGPQIDIHMGGEDLVFPHHENEIAQTEACTNKKFAKYWLHSGHILVDGKKMAKSAGNFYTLEDIYDKFPTEDKKIIGAALRHVFLFGKYRDQVNFSIEKVSASITSIKKLSKQYAELKGMKSDIEGTRREFSDELQVFMMDFIDALEDNFNSPEAIKVYFALSKFIASELAMGDLSTGEIASLISMLETFDSVFGFLVDIEEEVIPENIKILAQKRKELKDNKQFDQADTIRDEILELGYIVKDTPQGFDIEKK